MKLLDGPPSDEIFTYRHTSGVVYHFNASAICRAIVADQIYAERARVTLDTALVAHVKEFNSIDFKHALSLSDTRLEVPVVFVAWDDGTHTLVDGSHRLVGRSDKGYADILAFMVPYEVAKPYLVTDMPEVLAMVPA